jgi:hypothetical protein
MGIRSSCAQYVQKDLAILRVTTHSHTSVGYIRVQMSQDGAHTHKWVSLAVFLILEIRATISHKIAHMKKGTVGQMAQRNTCLCTKATSTCERNKYIYS